MEKGEDNVIGKLIVHATNFLLAARHFTTVIVNTTKKKCTNPNSNGWQ